ncbi:hypothetical protein KY349_00230 [Candidatus Woesearchaeota archaeon]|nr:hypothetical protein [Candidatus Woesearchaeota archaeon]
MTSKKDIFKRPSAKQIMKGKKQVVARTNLVERILEIDPETQYLLIDRQVIPEMSFYKRNSRKRMSRTEASRMFMKHGPEVMFPRLRNRAEALARMKDHNLAPNHLRQEVYDKLSPGFFCAYSFRPAIRRNTKRKVPLTEVLEGAKIYAYAQRHGMPMEVKPYADSAGTSKKGGSVIVTVPSRTPKQESYTFAIHGIAVKDDDNKYIVANRLISTHSCFDTMFKDLKYNLPDDSEDAEVFNWDAHAIAGFYATIGYFIRKDHNTVPLQMSPMPLPSRLLVDVYQRFTRNAVILTNERKNQKKNFYPLNNAELEIAVENAVIRLGHDNTLFCQLDRDGALRDYDWIGM